MSDYWEKRSARRIPVDCMVVIKAADNALYDGVVKDLSVDGISIETTYNPAPAVLFEIDVIPPPGSIVSPLRAVAEVIRSVPSETEGHYTIAASIKSVRE